MKIAFVTADSPHIQSEDVDRPLHDRAFARAGVALAHRAWDDPSVDWSAFDLLVLRSPWNYCEHLDAFLAWLGRVENSVRVENPAALVRWNLDKHYLRGLDELGVAVVPTQFADSQRAVEQALSGFGEREIVVKPSVSAGSRNTGRHAASDPQALALARRILAEGRSVMLQPFATSVAEAGETSLVCFAGEFSHAFRKGPILASGGGFLHGEYREDIAPAVASDGQRRVAAAAASAVAQLAAQRGWGDAPLLYARYDLVVLDDGRDALLEAELFEPSFFLSADAQAAARFARAVCARAETR